MSRKSKRRIRVHLNVCSYLPHIIWSSLSPPVVASIKDKSRVEHFSALPSSPALAKSWSSSGARALHNTLHFLQQWWQASHVGSYNGLETLRCFEILRVGHAMSYYSGFQCHHRLTIPKGLLRVFLHSKILPKNWSRWRGVVPTSQILGSALFRWTSTNVTEIDRILESISCSSFLVHRASTIVCDGENTIMWWAHAGF